MLTREEVKKAFTERGIVFSSEYTQGNYDTEGKYIQEKIPTLTTEFCEIGFYKNEIYLVCIAESKTCTEEFLKEVATFQNVEVYGFTEFQNNYDLTHGMREVLSESLFQVQCTLKIENVTLDDFLHTYTSLMHTFTKHGVVFCNQLK